MPDDADTFWGRCSIKTPEEIAASPFHYDKDQPHWRDDDTCSHCGGMRPSIALKAIREGATVEPTDKSYKMYVKGAKEPLPSSPANKCYFNHFSEAQAVEFVLLHHTGKMKLAHPGHFYSGLCFSVYKEAITQALKEHEGKPPDDTGGGSFTSYSGAV